MKYTAGLVRDRRETSLEEAIQKTLLPVARQREHGTDLGPLSPEEQGKLFSWEGKVVLEADILDKLGASTITDTLLSLGGKHQLGFECRRELANGRAMQRAAFFKDYIWTETGKSMAAQRFGFFLKFLDQLEQEVIGNSMPLIVESWMRKPDRILNLADRAHCPEAGSTHRQTDKGQEGDSKISNPPWNQSPPGERQLDAERNCRIREYSPAD
jgi:hypothetical protein